MNLSTPLLCILLFTIFATSFVTVTASSCDDIAIVCPSVVIPLPTECADRNTTHYDQIPEHVCTCVWDKCSCGWSCHFPQCSKFNTTVTCHGEPCQSNNCTYGCTNDYCNGCNGFCWEKPFTPTNTTITNNNTNTSEPTTNPTTTPIPTTPVPSSTAGIENGTCLYEGRRYTLGQTYKSADGCSTCTCELIPNHGLIMSCAVATCWNPTPTTSTPITISSTGGSMNDTCIYHGKNYSIGTQHRIECEDCRCEWNRWEKKPIMMCTITDCECPGCKCGLDGQWTCNNTITNHPSSSILLLLLTILIINMSHMYYM